jgi:hypothetical protein
MGGPFWGLVLINRTLLRRPGRRHRRAQQLEQEIYLHVHAKRCRRGVSE